MRLLTMLIASSLLIGTTACTPRIKVTANQRRMTMEFVTTPEALLLIILPPQRQHLSTTKPVVDQIGDPKFVNIQLQYLRTSRRSTQLM